MSMVEVIESERLRRFTVEEYHLMAEAGVFAPDERVELIRGVIREMTPRADGMRLLWRRPSRFLRFNSAPGRPYSFKTP
jgi:hypothetical protein